MITKRKRAGEVRNFILANVNNHSTDIAAVTSKEFGVSRQSVSRHLRYLADWGLLTYSGNTRSRTYKLKPLFEVQFSSQVGGLQEDTVWREQVLPHLIDVPPDVLRIIDYGFTEMLNNVIDHSEADQVQVNLVRYALNTEITINDQGVGIFNKIQSSLGLDNPRHALLELSKGKLTTDPDSHTGQEIFFSSRMFDVFSILSGEIGFIQRFGEEGWVMDAPKQSYVEGTFVLMNINDQATHTIQQIFEKFAPSDVDDTFSRTHVALRLAKHEGENLISRSQAKRLMARVDNFNEVVLDFSDIDYIGHSFADEVFRVFANRHPEVFLVTIETSAQVNRAIQSVRQNVLENTQEVSQF